MPNDLGNKQEVKVLIVDDDHLVLSTIESLLVEYGYSVITCDNADEALQRLRENNIDAVLTDVRMPSTSGIELLEETHDSYPELPVLLMTAYADFNVALNAIQKGAFDFIMKPYRVPHLIHSIDKAIKYRKLSNAEKECKRTLEDTVKKRTQELANALETIEREKKFTESIIRNLNSGLMVLDKEGRIITVNPAGREILSAFARIIEGARLQEILGDEAAQSILGFQETTSHTADELMLRTIQGNDKIIGFSVATRENSSGEDVGLIVSFRDITDMKYVEKEMEKMNRLSTVAEIASAVAHEVRNPLAGIKAMTQAIEENLAAEDENKEYINRILKQVDRLNEILKEFFNYARPLKPKKEKTSLPAIVKEVVPLIRAQFNKKDITIAENYSAELPQIFVDPSQMQQILLNLFLNALDAIEYKGEIAISARAADPATRDVYGNIFPKLKNADYLIMHFTDTGSGMTKETAEKIFEPFFTKKFGGTGLGLSIAYRILKENNSAIFVDSEVGVGTKFTIFVPQFRNPGKHL